MSVNYISEAVKAIIGAETPRLPATHPVEASEVRRFHHATMDHAPRYFDTEPTRNGRYGGPVAPPAFPVHAFRREADSPDPLAELATADNDGLSRSFSGLPVVPISELPRDLNGGYQYELFRYARVGETVYRQSRYKDIVQREGRAGSMVLVIIEETYTTGAGELLLKITNTQIMR